MNLISKKDYGHSDNPQLIQIGQLPPQCSSLPHSGQDSALSVVRYVWRFMSLSIISLVGLIAFVSMILISFQLWVYGWYKRFLISGS
jgi:hypothetical protein